MNTTKFVTVVIGSDKVSVAEPITRVDRGLRLRIKGVALPATYEVDFSLSEKSGESVTVIGDAQGAEIPIDHIRTGKNIYAWIYWVGEDYGRRVKEVMIPNDAGPDRTDITPEPAQQSLIEQTIAKLNEAVEHAPKIGEDGYWYVWDPEEADYVSTGQKAQGKQGEKGDTGNSGVYIGEDEPEDEDVDVWIETDGEPDEMPEPLKHVKDAPSDNGAVIEGNVGANIATGQYSHAEGSETTASGNSSHSEGSETVAQGNISHAEGGGSKAKGFASHAEGGGTTASGSNSHAEGAATSATGNQSHAEGGGTLASGSQAHAEGASTTASGDNSHAEGLSTTASGALSHAGGCGTIAARKSQYVIGEYNAADTEGEDGTNRGEYVFIVGNGDYNNRSNAFAIKWDGTIVFANGTEITPAQFAALLALLGS